MSIDSSRMVSKVASPLLVVGSSSVILHMIPPHSGDNGLQTQRRSGRSPDPLLDQGRGLSGQRCPISRTVRSASESGSSVPSPEIRKCPDADCLTFQHESCEIVSMVTSSRLKQWDRGCPFLCFFSIMLYQIFFKFAHDFSKLFCVVKYINPSAVPNFRYSTLQAFGLQIFATTHLRDIAIGSCNFQLTMYPGRTPEGYNLALFDGRSYVEEGVFMGLEGGNMNRTAPVPASARLNHPAGKTGERETTLAFFPVHLLPISP